MGASGASEPWLREGSWFTSPWNFLPPAREGLNFPDRVRFHDTTLRELARQRPRAAAAFLAVHGVGARKAEELGERFLSVIRVFSA